MSSQSALRPSGPAEVQLPCSELQPALDFFIGQLGFRVETIYPADAPKVAALSGYGTRIRLAPGEGDPGRLRLACDHLSATDVRSLVAPNGTVIELVDADPPLVVPPLVPEFVVTRRAPDAASGKGRAGMLYRDLIPSRLGGRYIASHISIPEGGPLSDWPHFHKIRFQMIFCRRGWVRVGYEDQGPPIVMTAGDCVLQPPQIRHRVLESSEGLEVVEIGCPALHETLAHHGMEFPTADLLPDRDFGGQKFLFHVAAKAPWKIDPATGFERQNTGMGVATGGIADTRVLRPGPGGGFTPQTHDGDLMFGFLLEGSAVLRHDGDHALGPCDAFVIPPGGTWSLHDASPDLRLLQVVSPADS